MNILFPVSECVPFAKTGGLADVAGALPQSLVLLGHTVHVVMPFYRQVQNTSMEIIDTGECLQVPVGNELIEARIHRTRLSENGPVIHFLKNDALFFRDALYRGYDDNDKRFVFLSRGALELGKHLKKQWDIVHCHDWHTGLVPVMLKTFYQDTTAFHKTKSLVTIHNLAYQGHFSKAAMQLAQLPWELFHPDGLEFYDGLNFLKAGLVYADWISTVSRTYAREIVLPEMGCGLEGVLAARQAKLSGIVNGIDYTVWDPARDQSLPTQYAAASLLKKQAVKHALLDRARLLPIEHAPVIGMITRLDDQKGLDIFANALEQLMQLEIQIVILGTGEQKYHNLLLQAKSRYPRKLSVNLEFNNDFAHLIYGGTDMFLMPSKYEPCGLGQLISMKYGSIPVVRRIGGLADTVQEFDGKNGTGFSFVHYSSSALYRVIARALDTYHNQSTWQIVVNNAMNQDYSWDRSAGDYVALYNSMIQK